MTKKITLSKNIYKLIIILTITVAIIVGGFYVLTRRPKVTYQFDQIKVGNVSETVSADGSIKAAEDVDLSFEQSGKISKKNSSVGDIVKAGQILLTLDNSNAAAQLAQAQAALSKQLAGDTPEFIDQLGAAVSLAEANLDQVKAVSVNNIHSAEAVKLTSENNLKLALGGDTSRIVEDAYENMTSLLQSVQNTLSNSLTKADNILGIDNVYINDNFEDLLSVKDLSKLYAADEKYSETKTKLQSFTQFSDTLVASSHDKVDEAAVEADSVLASARDLLNSVSAVLDDSVTSIDLTDAQLDSMKTTIHSSRTDVSAKISSLNDQKHAVTTAKNSFTAFQIAFNKAEQDLQDITVKTTADIAAAQASLDKAKATLADAKNPPRAVDVAGYRAAVSLAQANYSKTILTAPIDGTISRQDGELGALASPNVSLVSIISSNKYQVEIYVAETDLPKIKVGNTAAISLDNLGDSQIFSAQVIKIDPSATLSGNGTSACKVTLQFTIDDERLKVGLSANVKIMIAGKENVLIIPSNDVVRKNGSDFVSILNSNQTIEQKQIEIGLKGDNGQWEVLSGLKSGDLIISFTSSNINQ
jgi:membrane fusion protein, macrolide-specific efflux system